MVTVLWSYCKAYLYNFFIADYQEHGNCFGYLLFAYTEFIFVFGQLFIFMIYYINSCNRDSFIKICVWVCVSVSADLTVNFL